MDNIEIGTETTCYCGRKIVWIGNCWDHTGDTKPRHPGRPQDENLVKSNETEETDYGSIYASVY